MATVTINTGDAINDLKIRRSIETMLLNRVTPAAFQVIANLSSKPNVSEKLVKNEKTLSKFI